MYYGVSFDDVHTSDWGLTQSVPAEISAPEPNLYQIEIPGNDMGADGAMLDLTEPITGRVTFKQRAIRIPLVCRGLSRDDWPALQSRIASAIHGQKKRIVFDDDPDYYWYGRCYVDGWNASGKIAKPVITADVGPFKWELSTTELSTSWDSIPETTTTISSGKNVSTNPRQVDLRFGTAEIPTGDFSLYTRLEFTLSVIGTGSLQLIDSAGQVYSVKRAEMSPSSGSKATCSVAISALRTAGLDPAAIYRINLSGGTSIRVDGVYLGIKMTIPGGVRNRDLIITCPTGVSKLTHAGNIYSLLAGENYLPDLMLEQGDNDLNFTATADLPSTGSISVSYVKGWL